EALRGHSHLWSKRATAKVGFKYSGQQSSNGIVSDYRAPVHIEESSGPSKTLKIALVISEFPSINETFILDQITGLINRGHAVDIYATAPKGEPTVHEEIRSYKLLERTVYRDGKEFEAADNPFLRFRNAVPLVGRGLRHNPKAFLNSINVFRAGRSAA